MKNLLFIIFVLSVFTITSCDNTIEEMDKDLVYIRLENISDEKMKDFTLNNTDFGTIKSGRKSAYHGLEAFSIQGTYPWATYECEINGEIFTNEAPFGWCATGLMSLEPGQYTVKVNLQQLTDEVSTLSFEVE